MGNCGSKDDNDVKPFDSVEDKKGEEKKNRISLYVVQDVSRVGFQSPRPMSEDNDREESEMTSDIRYEDSSSQETSRPPPVVNGWT
jgi:hypothetical protein